jgi:hypothetical protein
VFGFSGGVSVAVAVTPSVGSGNTFVLGYGMKYASHVTEPNTGSQGLYIETGVDEQCHIETESDSGLGVRLHLKRGSTIVATSSYFGFGVWHYFEWKLTVRTATAGAYELRHNGVLDISGTSVDLASSGGDGWDVFSWRYSSNVGTTLFYDDVYICDGTGAKNNDFLGPSIVEAVEVSANGVSNQFDQNSSVSAAYTHVDDAGSSAPDDSTLGGYIGSDTNAHKDLFAMTDLTQISGTIHAVQLGVQMAMGATGTRTVKTKYRDPDTTQADGTSRVVDSTVYDEFTEVFDNNPASAAAWDVTDIDGGQFGVEVVS